MPVRYETVRFLYRRIGRGTGIVRHEESKESVTGCLDSVNVTLGWSRSGETGGRDGMAGICIARFVGRFIVPWYSGWASGSWGTLQDHANWTPQLNFGGFPRTSLLRPSLRTSLQRLHRAHWNERSGCSSWAVVEQTSLHRVEVILGGKRNKRKKERESESERQRERERARARERAREWVRTWGRKQERERARQTKRCIRWSRASTRAWQCHPCLPWCASPLA